MKDKEDLKENKWKLNKILRGGQIPGFDSKYTGYYNGIGTSTCYNSPLASSQLTFVLALGDHPLIKEVIEDEDEKYSFDPEPFVKAKVLDGMKILDLGCGYIPTFARCSRWLGADTYTVDVVPADKFEVFEMDELQREIELENHIEVNLNDPEALDTILRHSEGNFDIITSAHLYSGDMRVSNPSSTNMKQMAFSLLKENGIYHEAIPFKAYRKESLEEFF